MSTSKKYSPEDLNALIKMASQIENHQKAHNDKAFSTAEVIEVAEAAGLSKELIEKALEYFDEHEDSNQWIPEKKEMVQVSRLLSTNKAGLNLEAIANSCRKNFNIQGTATQFGSTFEWSAKPSKTKQVHISVRQSDNVSKVDLYVDYTALGNRSRIVGSILGFIVLAILSSVLNLDSISNWVPALLNFSGAGLGYLLSSRFVSRFVKSKKREAELILDSISNTIAGNLHNESIGFVEEELNPDTHNYKKKIRH
jgi:phage gpG-like protein